MSEGGEKQRNRVGTGNVINLDKRADILQATFEHYYKMAMDHHTKAITTSNILLILVAAILTLVGLDKQVCYDVDNVVDVGSAIGVIVIALLGAGWAWKQHERYQYWEYIARQYQEELTNIVSGLHTGPYYYDAAQKYASKEVRLFGSSFASNFKERYLWPFVFGVIAVIGLGLLVISIKFECRPPT